MVDLVTIKVKAGDGGNGAVSFHREKFKPKGPPDGGDGGKGGAVYLLADRNLSTLYDLNRQAYYKAGDGKNGGRNNKRGKDGEDIYLKIPVGTQVRIDSGRITQIRPCDLLNHGEKLLVARGGAGGRGNAKFRTSKVRSPKHAEKGKLGEEKTVILELKLIADVGLIGLPNAGKTTLLNRLTHARGRIGRYPFTTIYPNLGVLSLVSEKQVVLADIPGLIEGAADGKGLGHSFLRHIERTKILLHLIDPSDLLLKNSTESIVGAYEMIRRELGQFSQKLLEKPEIVIISKIDLPIVARCFSRVEKVFKKRGMDVLGISAVTGKGVDSLTKEITKRLESVREENEEPRQLPVFTIDDLPNKRIIFRKSNFL